MDLTMPSMSSMSSSSSLFSALEGQGTWLAVSLALAVVGAFSGYFMFVKSNSKLGNNFLVWLRGFLDFQFMLIEPILKICYIFIALFITLASLNLIGTNFLSFVLTLVLGNLYARVIFEAGMVLIGIWKNTKEINDKTK